MARTGESYTAALRVLRGHPREPTMTTAFQRHTKRDHGYAVSVPAHWREEAPDPVNSASEIGRYTSNEGGRRVLVIHHQPMTGTFSAEQAARATEDVQAIGGARRFVHGMTTVAGRPTATLESERDLDDGQWTSRHYFIREPDELWVIVVGSYDIDTDSHVLDQIVESFDIVPVEARGDRPPAPHDRLTNPMIKIIPQARVIAVGLGHEAVGTDDLLLAMVADANNIGAWVLKDHDVTYDTVRSAVEPQRPPADPSVVQSLSPDAYKALNRTGPWLATQHGDGRMGADHLLLAIVEDDHAVGYEILKRLGADPERVRSAIHEIWRQRAAE